MKSGTLMLAAKNYLHQDQIYNQNRCNSFLVFLLVVVMFVIGDANDCLAYDGDLYLHGFVSQGYLLSTENNYPISNSVNGSAEFNEVGINIYSFPTEQLRLGFQLIGRDLGEEGNNALYIDWAYGDYHWRDYLGFRFGKIKMPNGLYNYTRDVDMLRTPIWLPESVYPEHWRDFTLAVEGFSLYGNSCKYNWGEFDYEIYGGSLNVPNPNSPYWSGVFTSATIEAVEQMSQTNPDSVSYQFVDAQGTSIVMPWVAGGGLFWKTPISGLRLGITKFLGKYELNFRTDVLSIQIPVDSMHVPEIHNVVDRHSMQSDYTINTYSIEYNINKLTFTGEYSVFIAEVDDDGPPDGWYYQADYQVNDHLSFSSYYSTYYSDSKDRDGDDLDISVLPNFYRWQNDLCLSTRIDLNDHWLIKFEGHQINGTALVKITQNDIYEFRDTNKLKENWMLLLAKTTFHF